MLKYKNYKEIKVAALQRDMETALVECKINKTDLAKALNTTSQTIDNAFILYAPKLSQGKTFKASDRIVCQVAKALGIQLAIVETGTKHYYINFKK